MYVGNKSQHRRRPWTEEVSSPTLSTELCRAPYLKAVMFSPLPGGSGGETTILVYLKKSTVHL